MSFKNVSLEAGASPTVLEETIGYTFQDKTLLRQALTHLSYAHEKGTKANEALAVLGDSLLNAMATWRLYQQKPDVTAGELTEKRKHYVSQKDPSQLAKDLDLERSLFLGNRGAFVSPRMLADAFESLVAAVFIDGGFGALTPFLNRLLRKLEEREKRPC